MRPHDPEDRRRDVYSKAHPRAPAGDGGRREGRRRRGRVEPSVRVAPGGRVRPSVRVGRGGVGPGGRVGWAGVAAGCKTCQGPSHRSRRVHISIPTMLMCTQRDRVNPPRHLLHNGDHVRLPML
jgi:hypothetical protein